jgi:hypothetical protein
MEGIKMFSLEKLTCRSRMPLWCGDEREIPELDEVWDQVWD